MKMSWVFSPALLAIAPALAGNAHAVITLPGKQIEYLDRGMAAMPNSAGKPFISWRALASA